MVSPRFLKNFDQTVKDSADARSNVRHLVKEGRWREAEPDRLRLQRFTQRTILPKVQPGAEAIQGDTADFQAAYFLSDGAVRRRAVGYVEVNDVRSTELGTGFLISPRLFLTCCHVIKDAAAAKSAQITFDREMTRLRQPTPSTTYLLEPDSFALFSDENQLDYALVAVGPLSSGTATPSDLGCCILQNSPDRHVIGMNVNIIQHPSGQPKMISVRNNLLTYRTDRTLLYETDTEPGSSGSPVFNDDWDLIALHHWGNPYLETKDETGKPIPTNVNEGVRISAIYNDLQARMTTLPTAQRQMLQEALSLAENEPSPSPGRVLSSPHSSNFPESLSIPTVPGGAMADSAGSELRFTIPIEVTVRVGSLAAAGVAIAPSTQVLAVEPKQLTRGSEGVKIDQDYSNRSGYRPDFIEGFSVPLPALNASLQKQLAPLRTTEKKYESGELKYEHFSIKINKSKKIAIYTATNIDGKTWLKVIRESGQVSGSEGDTWFPEPRMSDGFVLGKTFYSDWSTYFDRGHLTRREDPTWGSDEDAERANADTFHLTNCSPQHYLFNERAIYWQGVERYVLENGMLQEDDRKKMCVIQGPIFDDKVDLWSDDVQIPSSFFKIVVWKGADGPRAVGLVVDQKPLLSIPRKGGGGPPADLPKVDVNHWRVAIPQIEERTGVDFGDDVRNADTIGAAQQPQVGEAAVPIRSFNDIKL
jgi:endonuclease G, mitochondrial